MRMVRILLKLKMNDEDLHSPSDIYDSRTKAMNREKFESIISALINYELTKNEERFIKLIRAHFRENQGILNEEQKSMLEGLHREKRHWYSERLHKRSGRVL